LLQFIKVPDDVISFLCGSAAKFAPLCEHSRKSMSSGSMDILEILPHLVRTVTPQDMHLLGWCHVPEDKDPREIVVTGPVLHAFQVGGRIRARNRPINVSIDATKLELCDHVCLPDDPVCVTQPQGVFQLYNVTRKTTCPYLLYASL
jgi:hypothetical protein